MSMPRHRVLREVLRNYTVYETLCATNADRDPGTGMGRISSDMWEIDHDGMVINFLDLKGCLKDLSPRKREAVFYHVILDWKQKDVATQMGITTVSVGQYVEQGMLQIAKKLWPEEYEETEED